MTALIKFFFSMFKFVFLLFGIALIALFSVFGVMYIDQNNLAGDFMKGISGNKGEVGHYMVARLPFAVHHDTRPFVIKTEDSNNMKEEYHYIYPTQIYYACKDYIKISFQDSVFTIPYKKQFKKIKQNLESSNAIQVLKTESYVINKACIVGIYKLKTEGYSDHYVHYVKLLNGDSCQVSKAIYNKMKKQIEIAKTKFDI